jgi:hypothetical protein
MSSRRLQLQAERTIGRRTLVRVVRSDLQAYEGIPLAIGRRWLVLALMGNAIDLDGFLAVPLDTITELQPTFLNRSFYVQALRRRRAVIPALPSLDLDTTPGLLRSAQAWFSLLVIEREVVNPGSCKIGKLVRASSRQCEFRLVTTAARWERKRFRCKTVDITSVQFGGQYENALADVAGALEPGWR